MIIIISKINTIYFKWKSEGGTGTCKVTAKCISTYNNIILKCIVKKHKDQYTYMNLTL